MSLPRILIVLFVAGAGFERFDALQGAADFGLTPAVILSPLLVALRTWYWISPPRQAAPLEPSRRRSTGAVLLCAYLVMACVSVLFAATQGTAVRRLLLLVLIVLGGWAAVSLARLTEDATALRMGAYLGLGLAVMMDLLQLQTWLSLGAGVPARYGPLDVESPTYGLYAPRPSALSPDPNRGAFLVSLFLYLIAADPWTRTRRITNLRLALITALAGAVVIASFSRTGIVVFAVVLAVGLRTRYGRQRGTTAVVVVAAVLVVGVLAGVGALQSNSAVSIDQLIEERVNFSADESGGIHFELFGTAYQVLAERPWALLTGIGFGNSPTVLREIFDDNPAANFHSFYLTSLVELGLLGLGLALSLLLGPLSTRRVALAATTAAFNLLYQANLDASFWLVVALLWFAPTGPTKRGPGATPRAEPALDEGGIPALAGGSVRMTATRTPGSPSPSRW